MKKTFNPTINNQVDLERSILDLKINKNNLVNQKIKIQSQLTTIKENLKNPNYELIDYDKFLENKTNFINKLYQLENDIKKINIDIKTKRKLLIAVDAELKSKTNKELYKNKLLDSIIELKAKYQKFSGDHTRVSSLRVLASDFTIQLENIIKTV